MRSWKAALLYGLVVWIVPFVSAFVIFPLRTGERPLFESIMPVVLAATVVACSSSYYARVSSRGAGEGARLGALWLVISLALDSLMFSRGPMEMTLADYVKDIGVTYLMIPAITAGIGAGWARGKR